MAEGWTVTGTCRNGDARSQIENADIEAVIFDGTRPLDNAERLLSTATFVLSSVPPDTSGDPVLALHGQDLERIAGDLQWVGYLSTTGVYGDTGGATVDETSPLKPSSNRSRRRVEAEKAWLRLHRNAGVPVHIFRLAGIYGPGRHVFLSRLRAGVLELPGDADAFLNLIHRDDACSAIWAVLNSPPERLGRIYNVSDGYPIPRKELAAWLASKIGVEEPVFTGKPRASQGTDASESLPNRKIDNGRLREELDWEACYPSFREGYEALLAEK